MSEHQEQCALFQWAALKARQIPELQFLFAVPNGGFRHKATAGRLRAEGMKAGVPDIQWPVPRGQYHGLFIEMKFGKNKPTKRQQWFINFLDEQGYYVQVCYGWSDASNVIQHYWKLGPYERKDNERR